MREKLCDLAKACFCSDLHISDSPTNEHHGGYTSASDVVTTAMRTYLQG